LVNNPTQYWLTIKTQYWLTIQLNIGRQSKLNVDQQANSQIKLSRMSHTMQNLQNPSTHPFINTYRQTECSSHIRLFNEYKNQEGNQVVKTLTIT